MKKDEIKAIKAILEEHRVEDKKYFLGLFALSASILVLFASVNVLYRGIVAILLGRYGWLLLKQTKIADKLPSREKK